jgi:hypothetical protein
MTTDTWTFTTSDTSVPYITNLNPADDTVIAENQVFSFNINDDGGGVELAELVVYINGEYYSLGGGAVTVTNVGTSISSTTSYDLNGANYAGDTTGVAGGSSNYTITIDPEANFAPGEGVTFIVYAQDIDGNLMPREVYTYTVDGGGVCVDGSSYCGNNTNWNGAQCIGVGGGGSLSNINYLENQTQTPNVITTLVSQVDEQSVIVTMNTTTAVESYIVYGQVEPTTLGDAPGFGYDFVTETNAPRNHHTFLIEGLENGVSYVFQSVLIHNGEYILGEPVRIAPLYQPQTVVETIVINETQQGQFVVCERAVDSFNQIEGVSEDLIERVVVCDTPSGGDENGGATSVEGFAFEFTAINNFKIPGDKLTPFIVPANSATVVLQGLGIPGDVITFIIY